VRGPVADYIERQRQLREAAASASPFNLSI
jgi:hypothetical protein